MFSRGCAAFPLVIPRPKTLVTFRDLAFESGSVKLGLKLQRIRFRIIQGKATEKRKKILLIFAHISIIGTVKRKWKATPLGPMDVIICPLGAAFSPELQKSYSLDEIIIDLPSSFIILVLYKHALSAHYGPDTGDLSENTVLMFDFFHSDLILFHFPVALIPTVLISDHLHHFGKTLQRINHWHSNTSYPHLPQSPSFFRI